MIAPRPGRTLRFHHERLEVYGAALDFIPQGQAAIVRLAPRHLALADQLARASTSIVLNLAEGCEEFSKKEKARFYRMARRSAAECAVILDVGYRLSAIPEEERDEGKALLNRITAMLTALARSVEET